MSVTEDSSFTRKAIAILNTPQEEEFNCKINFPTASFLPEMRGRLHLPTHPRKAD